jgi:hypothetical protein
MKAKIGTLTCAVITAWFCVASVSGEIVTFEFTGGISSVYNPFGVVSPSLIWLEFVKRAQGLRSEILFHLPVCFTAVFLNSAAGTLFLRWFHAEIRESTRRLAPREVINRSRSDAARALV